MAFSDINKELTQHGHEVVARAGSLNEAHEVLLGAINGDEQLMGATALVLDGTLTTFQRATGPRPDFVGPYAGSDIPPELLVAEKPTGWSRLRSFFARQPAPAPPPTETIVSRNDFKSDAAMVAHIVGKYQLGWPIIGMSGDPLALQGVEIDRGLDLTKNRMHHLGPLVTRLEVYGAASS